jgi:hypothetical protein
MLATRADQENLIHEQQTAAAAKPLNQGLRGLTAKTPGNKAPKTPFKVPLNDENAQYNGGKSVLKTNGKAFDNTLGKKGPVFDKNAFVTPAGPRNRPALGVKTTNAKANVFKTPANKVTEPSPLKHQKTGSPRLRRPKLKVLKPEVVQQASDDSDVEPEYMPPKAIRKHLTSMIFKKSLTIPALPDIDSDDEFGPNKTFPHLAPENLMRGWESAYLSTVDENGLTEMERQMKASQEAFDKQAEQELQKALDEAFAEIEHNVMQDLSLDPPSKTAAPAAKKAPPLTLLAKNAASALSRPNKPTSRAVPTSASSAPKQRGNIALNVRKTRQPMPAPSNPASQRHVSSTSASRSTVGYAQGRAISQHVRKPLTSVFRDKSSQSNGKTSGRSVSDEQALAQARDVVNILRVQDLSLEDDEDEDDGLFGDIRIMDDDELDDFQLQMPKGLDET